MSTEILTAEDGSSKDTMSRTRNYTPYFFHLQSAHPNILETLDSSQKQGPICSKLCSGALSLLQETAQPASFLGLETS
jgi:hypothetical protein